MNKVTTGCRDCKNCTNSGFAHFGRSLGRKSAALATLGMSSLAMATQKKCRVCGHQMSLHVGAEATTPQPAVEVQNPQPQLTVNAAPATLTIPERLAQLDSLAEQGLITKAEHAERRRAILADI